MKQKQKQKRFIMWDTPPRIHECTEPNHDNAIKKLLAKQSSKTLVFLSDNELIEKYIKENWYTNKSIFCSRLIMLLGKGPMYYTKFPQMYIASLITHPKYKAMELINYAIKIEKTRANDRAIMLEDEFKDNNMIYPNDSQLCINFVDGIIDDRTIWEIVMIERVRQAFKKRDGNYCKYNKKSDELINDMHYFVVDKQLHTFREIGDIVVSIINKGI